MEQSRSWEANQFEVSQEIPHILPNLKVHYHIHKYPPPVPIVSQLDSVHTPTSQFLKIHLDIIFPSVPESPKWSLSIEFPHQNPVYTSPLPHTCHMPCPSHLSQFYHLNNNGWGQMVSKFWKRKASCLCRTAQNSRATSPQPGHYTEVRGGFPESIRLHEAVQRFSNFSHSNSFLERSSLHFTSCLQKARPVREQVTEILFSKKTNHHNTAIRKMRAAAHWDI